MKTFYTDGKLGRVEERSLKKKLESLSFVQLKKVMDIMKARTLGQLIASDKEKLAQAISKVG